MALPMHLADLLSAPFAGPAGALLAALLTALIVAPLAWAAGRRRARAAARRHLRRAVTRALGQAEARMMNTLAPLRAENRRLRDELAQARADAEEERQAQRERHHAEIHRLERLRMNAIEDALRAQRAARAAGVHVPSAGEERRHARAFAPTAVDEGPWPMDAAFAGAARAALRPAQRAGVPEGVLLV